MDIKELKEKYKNTYIYANFENLQEAWKIPAFPIAHNRAKYYAKKDSETGVEKFVDIYLEELEVCLNDNDELLDWAKNNMYWSQLERLGTQIPYFDHHGTTREDEWANCEPYVNHDLEIS